MMTRKPLTSLALTLTLLAAPPLSVFAAEASVPAATATSPTTTATPSASGSPTTQSVINPAASTPTPENPIRITVRKLDETEEHFSSRWLRQKYDTYTLVIQNTSQTAVRILSADIPERLSPEDMYARMKHSAGKRYAATAGMGLATAPLTFGVSLAVCLLLLGPIDAVATGSYNRNMLQYLTRFPGKLPLDLLPAGEVRQMNALTAYSVQPHLYLSVQEVASQQTFPAQSPP
jgi:hypothetical protein